MTSDSAPVVSEALELLDSEPMKLKKSSSSLGALAAGDFISFSDTAMLTLEALLMSAASISHRLSAGHHLSLNLGSNTAAVRYESSS